MKTLCAFRGYGACFVRYPSQLLWCLLWKLASNILPRFLSVYFELGISKGRTVSTLKTLIRRTSQWARWRLKSPASPLFTEPVIQLQIKKHQSSASLALVRGIHRWRVNSPHKWPVAREMFPFDDDIMSDRDSLGGYVCRGAWIVSS